MTDCLFCKIISRQIPAEIVYEDDDVLSFLDIKPTTPGHTLVIPKQHSVGLHDAEPAVLEKLIVSTQVVARALLSALDISAFNLIQNNGSVAGQVIPHLHFHLIPRYPTDGLELWRGHDTTSEARQALAVKIKASIAIDRSEEKNLPA